MASGEMREVKPVEVQYEVVLTLSVEEAQAIADIMGVISGYSSSRRTLTGNVSSALGQAGVFSNRANDLVPTNTGMRFLRENESADDWKLDLN